MSNFTNKNIQYFLMSQPRQNFHQDLAMVTFLTSRWDGKVTMMFCWYLHAVLRTSTFADLTWKIITWLFNINLNINIYINIIIIMAAVKTFVCYLQLK